MGVLGATDYWMGFEWQHRGSPHVHGLAWLPNVSDIEQEKKSVCIHGIPVNVSPTKESHTTKGLDAKVSDGKKATRLVSFDKGLSSEQP